MVVTATVGVWTQRTLSNTDRYVALVAPLADDPAVTNALAARLTDEVFVALDVEDRVRGAIESIPNLPSAATFLAGPITTSARNLIQGEVEDFLASDTFATLWEELNRQAHVKLQALLNGDYEALPNVEINGGEVQLNLVSLVASIIQRLSQRGVDALGIDVTVPSIPPSLDASAAIGLLASALGVSLPPDFGQVTLMSAQQLRTYQDLVRTAKRLVLVEFLLALALVALTIVAAPDRRRAVVWLAVGITAALLLGGVFLRRVEANIADRIARPGARAAALDVFAQVSAGLRRAGLLVLLIAVVAGVAAYLLGRPAWFRRLATWAERVTEARPGGSELEVWVAHRAEAVRILGIAAAVVVLFVTGIDWLPVLFVGALLGLLLWGVSIAEQRVRPPEPTEP
jgi:hypothetical protein